MSKFIQKLIDDELDDKLKELTQHLNLLKAENVAMRALLQECSDQLEGEPYGARNDFNDDAIDSFVESNEKLRKKIAPYLKEEV